MPVPRSLWSSKRHRENRLHQTWAGRGTSPGIRPMPGDRNRPPIRRLQTSRRPDLATSMIRTSAPARRILPSRIGRRHRSRISRRRITSPSRIGLNRADRPQRSRPIGPSRIVLNRTARPQRSRTIDPRRIVRNQVRLHRIVRRHRSRISPFLAPALQSILGIFRRLHAPRLQTQANQSWTRNTSNSRKS
jgi:hypothetical protein